MSVLRGMCTFWEANLVAGIGPLAAVFEMNYMADHLQRALWGNVAGIRNREMA